MPARAAGSVSQRPEPQAMAGLPAHAGGPAISKRSSEERISLNEAFKKPPVLFRPEKKEHRKVNVDELKKIIDETVNKKEEE